MKLISMTDFVLEQSKLTGYDISDYDWIIRVVNYARFLKKPLTIGMFVPCDEDGNVLEQPTKYSDYLLSSEDFGKLPYAHCNSWFKACEQYEKSKQKVLFEGCSKIQQGENTIVMFNDSAIWLTWTKRCIEDLVRINPELTESAIKQIGL